MFWLISKNPLRFLFLLKGRCLLFYSCKNLFTDEIDNFFAMFYGHSPGWIGLYSNDAKYAGFRVVWYASDGCNVGHTCFVSRSSTLIPTVVLKIDSAIYLIYPSTHLKSIRETSCLIHWIEKRYIHWIPLSTFWTTRARICAIDLFSYNVVIKTPRIFHGQRALNRDCLLLLSSLIFASSITVSFWYQAR